MNATIYKNLDILRANKSVWVLNSQLQIFTAYLNVISEGYSYGKKNDYSTEIISIKPHICKYCNAVTTQPDSECYKAPKKRKSNK